jgi:hypothetical protein
MAAAIPFIILDDEDDEVQITGTAVRCSASACEARTCVSQGKSLFHLLLSEDELCPPLSAKVYMLANSEYIG